MTLIFSPTGSPTSHNGFGNGLVHKHEFTLGWSCGGYLCPVSPLSACVDTHNTFRRVTILNNLSRGVPAHSPTLPRNTQETLRCPHSPTALNLQTAAPARPQLLSLPHTTCRNATRQPHIHYRSIESPTPGLKLSTHILRQHPKDPSFAATAEPPPVPSHIPILQHRNRGQKNSPPPPPTPPQPNLCPTSPSLHTLNPSHPQLPNATPAMEQHTTKPNTAATRTPRFDPPAQRKTGKKTR